MIYVAIFSLCKTKQKLFLFYKALSNCYTVPSVLDYLLKDDNLSPVFFYFNLLKQ